MIIVFISVANWTPKKSNNFEQDKDTIKIGVVTALSGNGATLGQPMVEGIELAISEINAQGGINGRALELFIEDGKLQGGPTSTATKFILETAEPHVMMTLYHIDAEVMSPLTKEANVPLLHASFARSILPNNPSAFKINFDAEDGCQQLVAYAKENKKYKKLGALMSRVAYNEFCLKGAKEIEPDISEYWYNFGDTDFRTLLLKANQDGVDALLTVGIDFEYIGMFRQLSQLDYDIKLFCATASECINPGLAKEKYSAFEDTLSVDFVHPEEIVNSDFSRKYFEKYSENSGVVVTYAGLGYDAVMILKDTFSKCDPEDKPCVLSALGTYKNLNDDSVIGTIGFEDRILKLDYNIYGYSNKWDELA